MTASVRHYPAPWQTVQVAALEQVAQDVLAIELRPLPGASLTPFNAGSHIDVELPIEDVHGGPVLRQYSLCNDPAQGHRYLIAVGLDALGRGGSRWIHQQLKLGDALRVGKPRNQFPLVESSTNTVLIAGGIGVTPLLAMARRLSSLGRSWTFFYCARTPERAAFLQELQALPGKVIPVFDGLADSYRLDLDAVVAAQPRDAHFYCCGPSSLMEAFERAASPLPAAQVHVEWFKPRPLPEKKECATGTFEIKLARHGGNFIVPPDRSILDVLVDAGIQIPHSCCDGVCGTCETRVIKGVPDHRDSVLFGEDAKSLDRMMVCVSRSAGPSLTLDL